MHALYGHDRAVFSQNSKKSTRNGFFENADFAAQIGFAQLFKGL